MGDSSGTINILPGSYSNDISVVFPDFVNYERKITA
jgi:hypothetical protein